MVQDSNSPSGRGIRKSKSASSLLKSPRSRSGVTGPSATRSLARSKFNVRRSSQRTRFTRAGKRFDVLAGNGEVMFCCETRFLWYGIIATRPEKNPNNPERSVDLAHAACDAFAECGSFD